MDKGRIDAGIAAAFVHQVPQQILIHIVVVAIRIIAVPGDLFIGHAPAALVPVLDIGIPVLADVVAVAQIGIVGLPASQFLVVNALRTAYGVGQNLRQLQVLLMQLL